MKGFATILLVLLAFTAAAQDREVGRGKPVSRGPEATGEQPACTSASNAQNRTREPRIVQSASEPASGVDWNTRQPEGSDSSRPLDWWPFEVRPPFGRLSATEKRSSRAITIGNAAFTVDAGPPDLPPQLTDSRPLTEDGGYYLVHVGSPLSAETVEQLRSAGVHPLRYVPSNSYLMKIPPNGFAALSQRVAADGIFRYEAAYKISSRIGNRPLSQQTIARRGTTQLHLRVSLFPGEAPMRVAQTIESLGADTLLTTAPVPLQPGILPDGRTRAPRLSYIDIRLPAESAGTVIPQIARVEAVRWIEEIGEYRMASDWTVSGWVYGDSRSAGSDFLSVRQAWNNALHGEGILLGDVDTGVDFDHTYLAAPVSPAVAQESPATQVCPGGGPENSPKIPYYHLGPPTATLTPACYDQSSETGEPGRFGHGTATTGLMSADPTASDNAVIDLSSGTAPEAQIWMYDLGPDSGSDLALSPAELSAELERMGQAGASAVNLSFVDSSIDGDYDFLAEILDAAAWDQPELLPVQAAGNDGENSGPKNIGSIDSTGKNVLTVGGNLDNSPNDLYSFSSRGPTADGRYKPDVISPAHNILLAPNPNPALDETLLLLSSDGNISSGNSGLLYGPEGTSFSCASVTGLSGVVGQYFEDGFHPTGVANAADSLVPTSALIKGMIINSGLRMSGGGITDDARPGKDQGWGRVKLNDPLYFSADPTTGEDARRLVHFSGSFRQGATSCPSDSEIFTFDLFNVEEDLRITLTWTDYPGDHSNPEAAQLVNDLDLIITDPDSDSYYGNIFDDIGTGYSISGGSADRSDTVENVWLAAGESLATGVYTVEICPHGINDGGMQNFSLVVTGGVRAGEKVQFDQLGYSCADTVGIEVRDFDETNPTVDLLVTSNTTGDSEILTISASAETGAYAGSIQTVSGAASAEDGFLQVADGETIEVSYLSSTDTAIIECTPIVCYADDLGPTLLHECDHDGFADNNETIHLYLPIRNDEAFPLDGVSATLVSGNTNVTVDSGTATYGTIEPGAVALPGDDGSDDPFVITVSGAACDEPATLSLSVIEGSGWFSGSCTEWDIDLQLNRDPFPIQAFDFDDGSPQGWAHEMAHGSTTGRECAETYFDVWNTFPTTTRSHSGSYSMQLGDGSYRTMLDAALVSPPLDVPSGGARLRFYYWMDADIYDSHQVWHGFIIEASTNLGGSWTQITPIGGYNAEAARNDCMYYFPFANTAPAFLDMFGGDGEGTAYTGDTFDSEYVVDLAPFASQTVLVRFRFGSDDYPSSAEGLYIDTITLEGFQCETSNVCDDGQTCTTESCDPDAGGCQYAPELDGTECEDGEVCTSGDECDSGICTGSDVISCDDGNECTDDWAEDDGDAVCDNPVADCQHDNNTQSCDDGNACTTEDICADGACTGGPALTCDDVNPCTDDSCNTGSGCVFTNNSDPCNDPYSCTDGDICSDGQCVATPNHALCDDSNLCTSDSCSPVDPQAGFDGCIHPAVTNGTGCDDASLCTDNDNCQAGVCTGDLIDCSDGASCTADLCDPVDECSNPGIDIDGDGYDICGSGDPVNPDGLVEDCNDNNADMNPGTEEDCFNNVDDDCNGLTDEADTAGCPRSDISGTVYYYRGPGDLEPSTKPVPGTTLQMVGTASGSTTSNMSGYYQFLDILKGAVTVIPGKVGDFASGISSLDASKISQHRVGMIILTDRQQVAGDVSGNGAISSYDAALISQLRVGIISRFPVAVQRGSDWAFEPEEKNYTGIETDQPGEDYLGILYGDVTGNWTAPGSRAAAAGPATAPSVPAASQDCRIWLKPMGPALGVRGMQRFALFAENAGGLLGFDLDVYYSAEHLSIMSVSTTERTSGFNLVTNDGKGVIKISLFGDSPFEGNGALLEFFVERKRGGRAPGFRLDAVVNEGAMQCSTESPERFRPVSRP